jgi:hydrogenase/urease accessory protein HupE
VIREAAPDTYYLDEEVWSAVVRTRRRLVITLLSVVAVMALGVLLGIIKQ